MFKSFKDSRHDVFFSLVTDHGNAPLTLGTECPWTIDATKLAKNSVVYSAGVGGDISFEKSLVDKFDCSIVLLDPSPTGQITMKRPENQHPKLSYVQKGLSASDGEICLGAPTDPEVQSSYHMAPSGTEGMAVPCVNIPTLMGTHKHSNIDLLKMDIEGFEYAVIEQICRLKIPVHQICVEFHHSLVPGINRSETIKAIFRLFRSGYRLVHKRYWDLTFVRRE